MSRRGLSGWAAAWIGPLAWAVPVLVVVAGLAATSLAVRDASSIRNHEIRERVELLSEGLVSNLEILMRAQLHTATSTAAAVSVDTEQDRASFARYAERLRDEIPSLLGVGYIRRATTPQLPELVNEARDDGAPEFEVRSPADGPDHAVIFFNEPTDQLGESLGVDLMTLERTSEALAAATDSGRTAVTRRVVLAIDRGLPEESQVAAYVAYAPVYRDGAPLSTTEERRHAVVGWSNVPFRAQDLLDELSVPAGTRVVLHDGQGDGRIASVGQDQPGSEGAPPARLAVPGPAASWTATVTVDPASVGPVSDRTMFVLAAGVLVTALLAGLTAMLATGSRRWARAARRANRTLIDSEAQLRSYAHELEETNRILGEYASIAAHDLSEPLTVVGGYADLLVHTYPIGARVDDAAQEHLRTITNATTRMRSLLDGIMEISSLSLEADDRSAVDLRDVVDRALANLEAFVRSSAATIDIDELPPVRGHARQLVQLFQNLLANAIRYRSPERPLEIRIEAVAEGDVCHLSIVDNGIGVPTDERDRIFTLFRRGRDSPGPDGLGIGLAVCRRIVELHGGGLTVDATPGGGATFRFSLPLANQPAPPVAV